MWRCCSNGAGRDIEAREAWALADAIHYATLFGVPLPVWASGAFNTAYFAGKLQKVFGPGKKGRRKQPVDGDLMFRVWDRVQAKDKSKESIGCDLFGAVGEELGLGEDAEARVNRLYYQADDLMRQFTGEPRSRSAREKAESEALWRKISALVRKPDANSGN
jgi:hypothetical protein